MFFERSIPHVYEGDLMKEDDLLGWLVHQKRHSEIPDITDEMKDKLIETTEFLAVIFCRFPRGSLLINRMLSFCFYPQTTKMTNRTSAS